MITDGNIRYLPKMQRHWQKVFIVLFYEEKEMPLVQWNWKNQINQRLDKHHSMKEASPIHVSGYSMNGVTHVRESLYSMFKGFDSLCPLHPS